MPRPPRSRCGRCGRCGRWVGLLRNAPKAGQERLDMDRAGRTNVRPSTTCRTATRRQRSRAAPARTAQHPLRAGPLAWASTHPGGSAPTLHSLRSRGLGRRSSLCAIYTIRSDPIVMRSIDDQVRSMPRFASSNLRLPFSTNARRVLNSRRSAKRLCSASRRRSNFSRSSASFFPLGAIEHSTPTRRQSPPSRRSSRRMSHSATGTPSLDKAVAPTINNRCVHGSSESN